MPDWATVVLIIGAVGGLLTGAAAFWTARQAARKSEVNALIKTVKALQEENDRLRLRLDDVEVDNYELRKSMKEVEKQNRALRTRIGKLEEENEELRETLGQQE